MKVKKGDKVKIISGKDKGKDSIVEKVYVKKDLVLVENINVVTKHVKPTRDNKGGIIKVNRPVHISNVMVICSKCQKQTRVGYKEFDGKKVRICKKCGDVIK
jgi:large subunit ribosomal protein L24